MVELDSERLRYPNDYLSLVGMEISALKKNSDLVEFTAAAGNGFSIKCLGREEQLKGLKEGVISEGDAEGIIKFQLEGKNLSEARPFMKIETWDNVVIK
ncbi:MAG: hypothetical protein HYT73_00620 [Candidatus Aenigmarchaeota archaeon]|nr:hypothetical protein [Candidatus Aenigmarchaeota archaeon]